MLNNDKIKLMTELSFFEKKRGKEVFAINGFFKSDYVGRHMLQSFFIFSFCYSLVLALWVLYHVESIMSAINPLDIISLWYVVFYVLGLVLFEIITVRFYSKKYDDAVKAQKNFMGRLKILERRYDNKDKFREPEGGKNA